MIRDEWIAKNCDSMMISIEEVWDAAWNEAIKAAIEVSVCESSSTLSQPHINRIKDLLIK